MPRNEQEFDYKTVNKSGNPTEDKEKVTKVYAYLKSSKARAATILGKKLEDALKQQIQVEKIIADVKEDIRPLINDVFDIEDQIWTRVVETAKIIIATSKATTRQNFNKEKFLEKIAKEFPNLSDKFQEIAKECISISNVASKMDVKLKTEGVGDLIKNIFGKLKVEISRIVARVKSYIPTYDKKLAEWKKELAQNTQAPIDDSPKPVEATPEVAPETTTEPTVEAPKQETNTATAATQPVAEAPKLPESYIEKQKKYFTEANRWL